MPDLYLLLKSTSSGKHLTKLILIPGIRNCFSGENMFNTSLCSSQGTKQWATYTSLALITLFRHDLILNLVWREWRNVWMSCFLFCESDVCQLGAQVRSGEAGVWICIPVKPIRSCHSEDFDQIPSLTTQSLQLLTAQCSVLLTWRALSSSYDIIWYEIMRRDQ